MSRRCAAASPSRGVVRALRGQGTLVLWSFLCALATFVVLPAAHTARHRADHVHEADGSVRWTPPPAPSSAEHESDRPAFDRQDVHHGTGGALHFGVTLTEPTPPGLLPAPVAFRLAAPLPPGATEPPRRTFGPASPRGPPLA